MAIASESQIANLYKTGDNYDAWLAWLKSVRAKYIGTPMLAKIDATIASGESKKSGLADTLQAGREMWKAIQEYGSDAWNWFLQAVGLGAIPVALYWAAAALTTSAVTGAIYTMNNWIEKEAAATKRELDQYNKDVEKQVAEGVPYSQAMQNAANAGSVRAESEKTREENGVGDKLIDKAGNIIKWALVGFAVYKVAEKKGWI